MNYLLHRHRCPGHIVPIPKELNDLMADISKEVIRKQPENIPLFVADFLEAMLLTRERTQMAQTVVADIMDCAKDMATFYVTTTMPKSKAKHVVNVTVERMFKEQQDNTKEMTRFDEAQLRSRLMEECGLHASDAIRAIETLKESYKEFYCPEIQYEPELLGSETDETSWNDKSKRPTQEEMNRAATCLQAAYRGFRTRQQCRQQMIIVPQSSRTPQQHTENEIVTIQSIARGYLTRKHLTATDGSCISLHEHELTHASDSNNKDINVDTAATVIQSIYRDHRARQQQYATDMPKHYDEDTAVNFTATNSIAEPQQLTRNIVKRRSSVEVPEKNSSRQSVSKKSNVHGRKLIPKVQSSFDDILVVQPIKLSPRASKDSLKKHINMFGI